MAGDNAVRSLLEKMTQCASNAYLGILERLVRAAATNICAIALSLLFCIIVCQLSSALTSARARTHSETCPNPEKGRSRIHLVI